MARIREYMKAKELRQKTKKELEEFLKQSKQKLGELKFSQPNKSSKNVKESRELRKDIARILTLLNNDGILKQE